MGNGECSIPTLSDLSNAEINYWFQRFFLETRKKDGKEYPPNTLLHLCVGLFHQLRNSGKPTLDLKDAQFSELRQTLDAEMKRLQKKGIGSKTKQAEPISESEEDKLWEKGELGDHNPRALVNTIVYLVGLYFALRSGGEHRNLRFDNSQIEIVDKEGERAYLLYTEDCSKNHPGGLKGRHIQPKLSSIMLT